MHPAKFWLTPKNQVKDLTGSSFPSNQQRSLSDAIYVSSSDDEINLSNDGTSKQLVLYYPMTNGDNTNQLAPDPLWCKPPSRPRSKLPSRPRSKYLLPPRSKLPPRPRTKPPCSAPRVLPAVGAFAVQCVSCFKWRLIPTEEKYEEIREHILQHPFVCEKAREWRPNISCDDPEDVSQDDSMIWAIDEPHIPQTPAGWQRLVQIRGEGSSQFADIYYKAPSGKKLRSNVTVKKFLADHPEYMTDGVTPSRFSFKKPKPLQENYVRKRSRAKSFEPKQDSPICRPAKKQATPSFIQKDAVSPVDSPAKKQATTSFIHEDEESPARYDLWTWI